MKDPIVHPLWLLLWGSLLTNPTALAGPGGPIVQSPQDQTVLEYRTATFQVQVNSPGQNSFTYTWFRSDGWGMAFVAVAVTQHPWYTTAPVRVTDSGSRYYVSVAKNGGSPAASDVATLTVISDVVPPVVLSATAAAHSTQVLIQFDEAMDLATATDRLNYTIQDGSGMWTVPLSAILLPDGRTVCLTLDSPLSDPFTIAIAYVADWAGNVAECIVPGTLVECGTAKDMLTSLLQQVLFLYSQADNGGLNNGAVTQLQNALDKLDGPNPNDVNGAIGELKAFIQNIGNGPFSSHPMAATFILVAQAIRDALLGC